MIGMALAALAAAAACLAVRPPSVSLPGAGVLSDAALLDAAGLRLGPGRWLLVRLAVAGALAAAAAAVGLVPLVGLAAGVALPSAVLRVRADAARQQARRASAHLVSAVHGALLSGAPLAEALRRAVATCDDRLARRPLERALATFAMGESLDEALLDACADVSEPRTRRALETLALGVSERLPLDRVAMLAGRVADRLRFDEQLDDEVRARASGLRAQVWILALVIPALALYLALTVPALASSLGTALGRTLLIPGAAALEIAGIFLSRRIVSAVR